MDTVSVSWEVLAGLLGKTGVELQSALMTEGSDGKKVLVDQSNIDKHVGDSFRARLIEQKDSGKNEHISHGKRAAYDEVEKFLAEHHGIPKGTDWKSAIPQLETNAKSKAATSVEVIQSSPEYKQMVEALEKEKTDHQVTKKGFVERLTKDKFSSQLNDILKDESLGLALPADEKIRLNQINAFSALIGQQVTLKMNEDGTIIPVDKDGKQLEDSNFVPVTLKGFIAQNAKTFWTGKAADPGRQAPPAGDPNGQGQPPAPNGTKFPVWKSQEEFSRWTDETLATQMASGKVDPTVIEAATQAFESQSKS